MKISRGQLRKIIQEELTRLEEAGGLPGSPQHSRLGAFLAPAQEYKGVPEYEAVKDAARAAKKAGISTGALVDAVKRA